MKKNDNELEDIFDENKLQPRNRGIYLLPNLFTTGGLFAGFYAIVAAMKNHFDTAAIAVFIAMITDTLDGRIARLTNTQTLFGKEYDSLADMVAFGVAPALLMYFWVLHSLGNMGWLITFVYVAAGALRLARFNTQIKNVDKRYFQGLSITASAGIMASMLWFLNEYNDVIFVNYIVALIVFLVALAMVSNIRYHSFKDFDLRERIRFVSLLVIILVFVFISLNPPFVLFIIFLGYGLSGPILTLWRLQAARVKRKKDRKLKKK